MDFFLHGLFARTFCMDVLHGFFVRLFARILLCGFLRGFLQEFL